MEEQTSGATASANEQFVVVRLATEYLEQFISLGSWIFAWQPKKAMRTESAKACIVDTASGLIIATAKLSVISPVSSFVQLRSCRPFQAAGHLQKNTWRNRITSGNSLFEWTITEIDRFSDSMVVETGAGRTAYVSARDFRSAAPSLQALTLKSSAEYFVGRLSVRDRQLLRENLQSLHGKRLTFGSTCSGTDIIVPVMKQTISVLCKLFNVSIEVVHLFSVEFEKQKREFIMDAHGDSGFHLFHDVAVFRDGGESFCDVCQQSHAIPTATDVLVSGPSCKNISKENRRRSDYLS
ncbi:unnamed protein product [Durusdinium trenchii]|uniref:Uncharacterized protein n=1 Tax=Durusdinium trenchii TaxID=1381693 RepID=A0ABP0NFQ8_9DINO